VRPTRLQLLIVLATSVAALTASAAASAGVSVTGAGRARFPDRLYLVNLDTSRALRPSDVVVRENGTPINGVEVTPARSARKGQVGVVLVLDASLSMRGAPIAGAVQAARAFLDARSANEQVAIVAFSDRTHVIQSFTSDSAKLRAALAVPPALSEGTHIYDAVGTALTMVHNANIHVASIVLLSDGADTGSRQSLAYASASAERGRVRIFTIGLRSGAFDPTPLRQLASGTSGSFTATANPDQLAPIYSALSSRLANEYLVSYRSPAGPGEQVSVTVSVAGEGHSVVSYATPALSAKPTGPFYPALRDRVWRSPGAPVVIALLVATLVGFGISTFSRPRPKTLRARLSQFVSVPLSDDEYRGRTVTGVASRVASERRPQRDWWVRFVRDVELADLTLSPERIAIYAISGAVIAGIFLAAIIGSPLAAIVGLVVPFAVVSSIRRRVRRKRDLFTEQLPDNLQVLASALRAGHSLVGALSVVVDDAEEPTRSEFRRVVADERLGVLLEDALQVVVERMQSSELAQVSLVASLQRRTGGNSAEVLDRVVETIRERAELRRLVKTLTAQGRISRWIVTALPIALFLMISLINPQYVAPLVNTSGGRIVLLIAAMFVAGGSFVINKIVDIKV
jgi:tight adherence protein B